MTLKSSSEAREARQTLVSKEKSNLRGKSSRVTLEAQQQQRLFPTGPQLVNMIAQPFDSAGLKGVLHALANASDWEIGRFREAGDQMDPQHNNLFVKYSDEMLRYYRDELRMLWKPPRTREEIPQSLDWLHVLATEDKSMKNLEEAIVNSWLMWGVKEGGGTWTAVWNKKRRELLPSAFSLPSILAYAALLHGNRMRYCRNKKCATPYFIAARRDQQYCSPNCAAPAKRASKLKWWRNNRGNEAGR